MRRIVRRPQKPLTLSTTIDRAISGGFGLFVAGIAVFGLRDVITDIMSTGPSWFTHWRSVLMSLGTEAFGFAVAAWLLFAAWTGYDPTEEPNEDLLD